MSDSLCTVKTLDGSQESGIIYKEKYLATEDGRIFSFKEKQNRWRQQKARPHTNGYLRVVINRKDEYVHRIIAFCFNDNPRGCKEVNHKDGNKKNNNASNLEWCTRSENNRHAFQTGLRSYSLLTVMANNEKSMEAKKKRRKLSFSQAQEIRAQTSKSDRELSEIYGISRGQIYAIRKFKTYRSA